MKKVMIDGICLVCNTDCCGEVLSKKCLDKALGNGDRTCMVCGNHTLSDNQFCCAACEAAASGEFDEFGYNPFGFDEQLGKTYSIYYE